MSDAMIERIRWQESGYHIPGRDATRHRATTVEPDAVLAVLSALIRTPPSPPRRS
jgi:hypothetical protein